MKFTDGSLPVNKPCLENIVMSSPAGLQDQRSQTNFLAKWIPSSSRAGVILNPSQDLTESFQHNSVWGSRDVDDSFASQFVPLPVSSSSSISSLIHDADARTEPSKQNQQTGDMTVCDRQFAAMQTDASQGLTFPAEMDTMGKLVEQSQDLPLMLKLQQLRQWQHHMQEQLKAHQLEELVRLQEEQQRLLGMVNVAQRDGTDSSMLTGMDSENSTPLQCSPQTNKPQAAQSWGATGPSQPPASLQLWRRSPTFQRPPSSQGEKEEDLDETLGTEAWSSPHKPHPLSGDDQMDEDDSSLYPVPALSPRCKAYREDNAEVDLQDRPIKPGIGGQKKTFEELLEEQLKLEVQRLKTSQHQSPEVASPKVNTKRAFLRRGEGLSRFTKKSDVSPLARRRPQKDPKAKVSSRWTSEPQPTQKVSQRPPVQRKTAMLNKENRPRDPCIPSLDSGKPEGKGALPAEVKTRVLGSHQRQNMETPGCMRPREVVSKVGGTSQSVSGPPAAVTKQSGSEGRTAALQGNGGVPLSRDGSAKGNRDIVLGYSFERSFQEKLRRWDCERQKESMELGEFELLEQAAEELSFSSNSSFVMKVLQLDQQLPFKGSRGYRPPRLSSTPVKSPENGAPAISSSASSALSLVREKEGGGEKSRAEEEEEADDVLVSKQHEDISDISFHSSSECEEVARPSYQTATIPSNLWENQLPTFTPPYDKRSYQDRKGGSGRAEEGGESDLDESTLLEDREEGGRNSQLVFDDDDTWNDLEEAGSVVEDNSGTRDAPTTMTDDTSPPERMLKRKVALAKGPETDRLSVTTSANQDVDALPPASQLMARLFPSLKPKTKPPPQPEPSKMKDTPDQQQQSRHLRERLVDLELEIQRFRTENAALARLRQDNEKNQEALRREKAEFEQWKAEELAKFEEFKREEAKKLQKERKVFEKHASAARAIPDKREREEIQALKQQLSSLQEELKRRESRWSNTHSRLRQQIDALSSDNSALRDEVRTLEKLRLSTWKKTGSDTERSDKGPEPLDSYTASEARGLKSTSPPETERSHPPLSGTSWRQGSLEASHANQGGIKGILKKTGPTPPPATGPTAMSSSEEQPASLTWRYDQPSHLSEGDRSLQTAESTQVKGQEDASQDFITHPDGKMERNLPAGGKLIIFPNGTRKEVAADGLTAKVTFFNGDIKQVMADQRVIYYYADAQTTHTTYPDGIEVLQFPNNQTEKHFPDGRKEITFPDQTIKNLTNVAAGNDFDRWAPHSFKGARHHLLK
ncbi:hypothetical protein UPYG_G00308530 [Umbra pygmaea]|uniref:Centromere protein J n=1 Tax=Umbra pygmaea TaxID=75934 RepID=A0ABD0WG43_UMBPY